MTTLKSAAPTIPPEAAPQRWVAVLDLDGTLTWRDTLFPFLMGFLRRHLRRVLRLWRATQEHRERMVEQLSRVLVESAEDFGINRQATGRCFLKA
jgi:hypothetical protein